MAKYILTKLIQSLNKDELKNFKLFASRIKNNLNDKKSTQLFELIKEKKLDEYSDEIIKRLTNGNRNNYYRLKNRLLEEIEHSLLLLHRNKDERFKINNWINIAQILTYKSNYELALSYLIKAEKAALKSEFYDLANIIYDHIIDLGKHYSQIPLEKYVQKRTESNQQYQQLQHFSSLFAIVKDKMLKTNFSGKDQSIIQTLQTIIEQLKLEETYEKSPQIQFQIYHCIRGILIQKKDFSSLKNYLVTTLKDFEQKGFFKQTNFHHEKIILLVWLINCLFKEKEITHAEIYIKQLYQSLEAFDKLLYNEYVWYYHQSIIVLYGFSNQNKKAIALLEELKDKQIFSSNSNYQLSLFLNLVTHHYCEGNIEDSLEYLSKIISSKWYDSLSTDFKLSTSILELIIRSENKDSLYIIYKINNIRKNFRKQLKETAFAREKEFIHILHQIAHHPNPFKNPKTLKKIKQFINNSPEFEPVSNEAISYQIWLKAKLNNQNYYELILQLVRPDLFVKV